MISLLLEFLRRVSGGHLWLQDASGIEFCNDCGKVKVAPNSGTDPRFVSMMKLSGKRDEPIVQSCGACRYYAPFEEDEMNELEVQDDPEAVTGYCRRYPPQYFPNIPVAISAWPEVSAEKGWCGEYLTSGDFR